MIKAGIIGATGYAGAELVRILTAHKDVEIVWYGSRSLPVFTAICLRLWTMFVWMTIWRS